MITPPYFSMWELFIGPVVGLILVKRLLGGLPALSPSTILPCQTSAQMFVHMDPDSAVCASVCVLAVARVTLNLGFPRTWRTQSDPLHYSVPIRCFWPSGQYKPPTRCPPRWAAGGVLIHHGHGKQTTPEKSTGRLCGVTRSSSDIDIQASCSLTKQESGKLWKSALA